MRSREPAICIRTTDYSETSQVVHFLTRDSGVVSLLAKGAKRPKSKSGGMIDLLAEGDLLFSKPNPDTLGTLMEFQESVSHTPLRTDARRLNMALLVIELVGAMLAEMDPYPDVFALLSGTLRRLEQPEAPLDAVLAWFQWRLLRFVGLLGGLDACVQCGTPIGEIPRGVDVYFSSRAGGILCDGCEAGATEKFRVEPAAMSALAALSAVETGRRVQLPEPQAQSVNRLLHYHITEQLGKRLRMAKYVLGMGSG